MNVYLPIAEMSVNIFLILGLGAMAGVLSGIFGIGGGFLMTPLLIFIGVPPSISVSTVANQIIASSVSGFIAHWRRHNVDFKMGWFLFAGGVVGSSAGVGIFHWLQRIGQIDLIISICYVTFLGIIGSMMAAESLHTIFKFARRPVNVERKRLFTRLPWQVHFPLSKLTISGFAPITIGLFVGIMVSLMGIGGGFFLVPAMIYILGMPTSVVIGTSLFQIIFITANVTLLQAITTQTVDIMLALLLLAGSVFGAQFGSKIGSRLPAEHLRGMLAALILGVAIKLAFGLLTPPESIYSVSIVND
ncbi:MAG: sulfite exporter TauE/SafE family protein [Alphaproteobacteria bacterium]|nr:sulfite exporter TauE/SafE family protein [Alphaproteobacteria bacterium]